MGYKKITCFKVNEKGFSPRPIAFGAEAENTAIRPNNTIKAIATPAEIEEQVNNYLKISTNSDYKRD